MTMEPPHYFPWNHPLITLHHQESSINHGLLPITGHQLASTQAMWKFPEMGLPLVIIHFGLGFSLVNHPFLGYPHGYGNLHFPVPHSSAPHSSSRCSPHRGSLLRRNLRLLLLSRWQVDETFFDSWDCFFGILDWGKFTRRNGDFWKITEPLVLVRRPGGPCYTVAVRNY